jgi:hypothetical protein
LSFLDLDIEFPGPPVEVAIQELAVRESSTTAAHAEREIAEADLEGVEVVDLGVEGGEGSGDVVEAGEQERVKEKQDESFRIREELDGSEGVEGFARWAFN